MTTSGTSPDVASDVGPQSGVRVATSTRGYDIAVHAYVGCSREALEAAGDLAMDEYVRVFLGMKQRIEDALSQLTT